MSYPVSPVFDVTPSLAFCDGHSELIAEGGFPINSTAQGSNRDKVWASSQVKNVLSSSY